MPATQVGATLAFGFADGNGGHSCDLGSAPSAGQLDVLMVNSDTVVTTPAGFQNPLGTAGVNNQGSYIFYRFASGSEGSTVTVTTSGNFNTNVIHSRWSGAQAFDVATVTRADAVSDVITPAHSTGTLATSDDLVLVYAALSSIGAGSTPNTPNWTAGGSGFTAIGANTQGSGAGGVAGFAAKKNPAGTAAETPRVSWAGNGAFNRYTLTVAFTTASGSGPADGGTLAGSLAGLTGALVVSKSPGLLLAGQLPGLAGGLTLGPAGGLSVAGSLPGLLGGLQVRTAGSVALAGSLAALVGPLTITGQPEGSGLMDPLLPDAELIMIRFIRQHAGLKAVVGSGKVGVALGTARPFVQVNRVAGQPTQRWEDRPRVQVSVWAATDDQASLIARSIVAALQSILSEQVRSWEGVLGPFSLPDEDNHRYVLDVELTTYATG